MTKFLLTALVATGFGFGCLRLRVPAGLLVGSLIGAAALNMVLGVAWMPNEAKWFAQIMAGTFIACSLDGEAMKRIPKLVRPGILIVCGMLITNLISGFIVFWTTPIDLVTALMGTVPGGMSDVPLISADMGADLPKVATMQFSRLLVAVGIYPIFIRLWVAKKDQPHTKKYKDQYTEVKNSRHKLLTIYTLAVAIFSGSIGKSIGIPAGALVFSMLTILALRVLGVEVYMPKYLKRVAQILSGAYVGSVFGLTDLMEMRYLIGPIIISNVSYLVLCVIMGNILAKRFEMPLSEAMLATTPGGSSDMVLIASEMGVDSREVLVFQMLRLMAVVTLFPIIIRTIVQLVS